eukprot:1144577-Pelagomonas_calceolata.AAC.2
MKTCDRVTRPISVMTMNHSSLPLSLSLSHTHVIHFYTTFSPSSPIHVVCSPSWCTLQNLHPFRDLNGPNADVLKGAKLDLQLIQAEIVRRVKTMRGLPKKEVTAGGAGQMQHVQKSSVQPRS